MEKLRWVVWIVCRRATVRVVVDREQMVVDAAPLVRKFVGQPFPALVRWMKNRFGEGRVESRDDRSEEAR